MRTSLYALFLCILLGGLIGCGGTNRITRYSTGTTVTCNQTYWYQTSGCMPPSTWTAYDGFVLPSDWYPLTLDFVYPSWWSTTSATLGIKFTSTCKDVGNCGKKTLQGNTVNPTDPNTRDDSNIVYTDFRFKRMIAGNAKNPQWDSYTDTELKNDGYATFKSDGKLDVVIRLLDSGHTSGTFNDYTGAPICTAFSTGYTIVSGTMYARRLLDEANKTWQSYASSPQVNFTVYLNQSGDVISFTQKNKVNESIPQGTYRLEIHNLQWNGPCLYYEQNSPSSYEQYCQTTHMRNLSANMRGSLNYCVNLEIGISWNKFTNDVQP